MEILMVLIIVACGIFSICGAVFNWDWYFNNRKARGVVAIFGRTGARIFYTILGVVIIVMGIVTGVNM